MASLTVAAGIAGVTGAFMHATTWQLGSVRLPVGLVLSLGTLAALLLAVRESARTRIGVSIVTAGWLLPAVVLSLPRDEGDVVVASNPAGLAFVLVGVVLIGVALGLSLPKPVERHSSPAMDHESTRSI